MIAMQRQLNSNKIATSAQLHPAGATFTKREAPG
jgi:hypothetical protein